MKNVKSLTRTAMFLVSLMFLFSFNANAQFGGIVDKAKKAKNKVTKTKSSSSSSVSNKKIGGGKTYYVSISTGKNKNEGTKDAPLKNIDKAISIANEGDNIYIAEGFYSGTFKSGFLESKKAVRLYGSWDKDFKEQDVVNHPTVFQPDNASGAKSAKPLLCFTGSTDGIVVNGIVFDMGERNMYHPKEGIVEGLEGGRLTYPGERPASGNATVQKSCIQFMSAGSKGGDVTIENCVFSNSAYNAIIGGHRSGKFTIVNNVFVANRFAAIEIFGTCAGSSRQADMVNCGEVEIAYNTILFNWSRLADFLDMGYGVRIMTKCSYNIHNNIIGASTLSGINNNRFCKNDFIRIDNNIMFGNKRGDLEYSPASNTKLYINVDEFEDLEFESVEGNVGEISSMPINQSYLKGFYSASYSETTEYDPNSAQNQWARNLGMNQQGKINSTVSMFMNKYPWKETLKLFGAVKGYGAQMPKK